MQCGRAGLDPWVGKIPWRRAWQPTPVFLPGESPWTEEPGRLQSMALQRVGATKHSTAIRISGYCFESMEAPMKQVGIRTKEKNFKTTKYIIEYLCERR